VTQKIKSLFFLTSVVLLTGLLFFGQSYAQSGSKITPRLLELSRQKFKGASAAPVYGENPKVDVLFTAATNTDAVDFSFFHERKIEYQKSKHYIEASIDAALIPELDKIGGIAKIDAADSVDGIRGIYISIQAAPVAALSYTLINAVDYNNNGIKGAGVKIAVLDTQYDGYQTRVSSSVISVDFTKPGNPPIDNSGTGGTHGTVCAGIAYDIVPEAQMYLARISYSVVSMENAYEWCFNNGVRIINFALNTPQEINEIINRYTDKGILTVVAAGNYGPGPNTLFTPAMLEKVLTVGAIDIANPANWDNGIVANTSSRGPGENGCIKPDILAPSSGGPTSWATPHVVGAAAILLSVADKRVCDTPAKLKALVLSFARRIGTAPDNNYGSGKLVLPNYIDFITVKTFNDVKYYPNPIQPSKGPNYSKMNFSNMPAGTRIKIYTMLGQTVRDLEADASGMAVWDGKNNAGEKAASGVYIVYMEDGNGNKKRIKIAVER